MDLIID